MNTIDPHVTILSQTNGRHPHKRFGIKQPDRLSHIYIIGKTGTGKSTLLESLVRQDLHHGGGLCLIDPHGDLVERVFENVPDHRRDDVIYFNVPDLTQPYGYNPLRFVKEEKRSLAASGMLEVMKKMWPDAWGVNMEHILRNAILALLEVPGSTMRDILRLLDNKSFRRTVADRLTNEQVKQFWLHEYEDYSFRKRADGAGPILNKVGAFLSDPNIFRILTAPEEDLHFRQIMDSDVGAYTYGQVHGSCTSGFAGLHAVTQVTGAKNATYCYDANGNMISGDGRTVTYTAFDKPEAISKAGNNITVSYGPDRARFKRVDQTGTGTTTTLYAAGKSYELITTASEVRKKHTIGSFAIVTETTNGSGTIVTTDFLHRDHLGSVDTITDENGTVVQRMSFDAWGKRREINWQVMTEPAILAFDTTLTTRGFTGHEMLDPVGLVHMNGRVYDPELGRFLSADPFVQDISNLQSWNRYSYVLNNPLSYTDPSGFFFGKIFKAIGSALGKLFQAIGSVFKAVLRSPIIRAIIQIIGCAPPHGIATCAATAAGLAVAAGGSIVDALKAGIFAFVQMGVWDVVGTIIQNAGMLVQSAVHGVVSGALSVAQGGNFLQGFVTGAIAKIGSFVANGILPSDPDLITGGDVALHTAIVAAAGCAASSAVGGKCANGAVTAAFANLYNNFRSLGQAARFARRAVPGFRTGERAVGRLFHRFNDFVRGLFQGTESGIRFGQLAVRATFRHGPFAGQKISDVAAGLRAGRISPDQLPVEFIVRNGGRIALNNRSLLALRRAGMQPTRLINRTGSAYHEGLLNRHLGGFSPSNYIRVRGGPPGTSLID